MNGFPFNEYDVQNVLKAVDKVFFKYKTKYSVNEKTLDEVKNDIVKGVYMF